MGLDRCFFWGLGGGGGGPGGGGWGQGKVFYSTKVDL